MEQEVDELYDGYWDSCMQRAEGDVIKAEELMNCTIFEYYYRAYQWNKWAKKQEVKK